MSNLVIPTAKFPSELDDNTTLFEVFNTSEAQLSQDFSIEDNIIYVKPREWEDEENWSKYGGFVNIEGELIYYQTVELENHENPPQSTNPNFSFFEDPNIPEETKDLYRRVVALNNILRVSSVGRTRSHSSGEWVRGYVMSQHHNSLAKALLGIETLIGVDNSTDHTSIDFRLRDLEELNIEEDDLDCPFGVFWYEIINQSDFTRTVQFHISIIGDFEEFEFVPKEGETPITDDLDPTFVYNSDEIIGASLTVRRGDCCACVSDNAVSCEPCEFDPAIDDIPILECPTIDPWDIPPFSCDCDINFDCPECEICTTETFPTIPTIPETIVLTGFPTEIVITVPEITIPAITTAIDVNVNVEFGGPDDQSGEGACFRLVPCGGTTS